MRKVTVVLPVFNAQDYIEAAVKSLLDQTYRDFELLIIDDGSNDRSASIVSSFCDPRIVFVRRDTNLRLIATLNEALSKANGEYIARMDADDVCHPERLQRQVEFLDSHPDVGVVGCAVQLIDQHGRAGPVYEFPEDSVAIRWAMAFLCPLAHPSIMARKDLLLAEGGYDKMALHAEDYDLWERLSRKTKLANLTLPLLKLRKHETSVTARESNIHSKSVLKIASRCMSDRLGYTVDDKVAACLVNVLRCDRRNVQQAGAVLMNLLRKYSACSPETHAIVRRDTALRLMMLALRCARGRARLRLIIEAHSVDSSAWLYFFQRSLSRLSGRGRQRLVG